MNLLALIGFAARDRSVVLALLLYIPLMPFGLALLALDLGLRGRTIVAPRFLLTVVGVVAVVCSGLTMIGRGPESLHDG